MPTISSKKTYTGGCHCGNIRYRAVLDINSPNVTKCNCSICHKNGYVFSPRVSGSEFELLSPSSIADATVGAYEFGSKMLCHHFCKTCGVSCFFRMGVKARGWEESEHVTFGVNILTLDPDQGLDLRNIKLRYWNGRDEDWSGAKDEPGPNGIW
ncbi:hypothetical protein N657DRAFT_684484 [Parathielavia appendiculata]|uniref:CENP-V/GFA domain-containing protein n=1 Tax=Parathielavia appendiculata TaxID=2587402 RepID=A0AAN6TSM1_9PEZI|nr:hypothetical protein N657DRAFT_684484 [Parathielavia appendiculata]